MQALRLLKKDGLVQDAPGRGVLVAPLDLEWIGKLYEVRGALDALAAKLAVQRGARIDKRLIAQGQEASRGKDVKSMIDADIAFHNAVYQASGNSLIADSAHLHWVHLRRVMGEVLQPPPSANRSGRNTRPSPMPSTPATGPAPWRCPTSTR